MPRRPQLRHQGVADRHDDRPAHGEQAGVEQGQPCPDGQPRAGSHPVSLADHGFDQRRVAELAPQPGHRHRDDVAERVGVGVPHVLEQFLRADQGAVGGQQRLQDPELLAGEGQRAEPRLARCRARSTVRSPRRRTGGADGVRRDSARTRATSSANTNGLGR